MQSTHAVRMPHANPAAISVLNMSQQAWSLLWQGTSGEKTRFVENLAEMVSCQVNAFSLRDRRSIRMLCTVAL